MTRTELTPHKYSESLFPQAEMLRKEPGKRRLRIGVPKEDNRHENRVMLPPAAVKQLAEDGHHVLLESGAGSGGNWSDLEYSGAGAEICSHERVYSSDIIVKVSPLSLEEIAMLKGKQTVFSALHTNTQTAEKIRRMSAKRITAVAYELIQDRYGFFPFVHSMSEISGMLALSTAGEYLARRDGRGIVLGGVTGVTPAKVMVLGAGTAAEYAARAAVGLGAQVKVFDSSIARLNQLKNKLGMQIYTSVFQKDSLKRNIKSADVLIGAAEFTGRYTKTVITEDMVRQMKSGAVIIDLNTDNLSYIESSHITDLSKPSFIKHDVIHYCVPNIASRAPRTASVSLSNALLPILEVFGTEQSARNIMRSEICIRNGTYIYEGVLTNEYLGKSFNIDYKDIELLTALF